MLQNDGITWEMIRINATCMGWRYIIGKETLLHVQAMARENSPTHYQTLHIFYRDIATPTERKQMLSAGYRLVC